MWRIDLEICIYIGVVGIPFFFLWRRFFRKRIADKSKRTAYTWLATLLSAPVCYVAVVMFLVVTLDLYVNKYFDRDAWNADPERRYEMTEDIIESEMLIGLTQEEVQQMLGGDGTTYYVGFVPGFIVIDPDVLSITYESGRVVNVRQYRT